MDDPTYHNPHVPQGIIVVNLYDGGGIEVTIQNYRPLGMHVSAVGSEWAGEVVGGMVSALVAEWVGRQKAEGRIRTV